jgi:hypothetical protein
MIPCMLISSTDQHTDGYAHQEEDALIIREKIFLEESKKDQQNAECLGKEYSRNPFARLIEE